LVVEEGAGTKQVTGEPSDGATEEARASVMSATDAGDESASNASTVDVTRGIV
jgi:hypothetical protein